MTRQIATSKRLDNDTFKITIGSVNKKSPNTFYITMGCMAEAGDILRYSKKTIPNISRCISKIANEISSNHFSGGPVITSVDTSEDSILSGKKSFFTIDMHFKQSKYNTFNDVLRESDNAMRVYSKVIAKTIKENNIECTKRT